MTLVEELRKADSAAITAEQERCFEAIRQELKDVAGTIRQYIQTAAGPDGPPCEMLESHFHDGDELLGLEVNLSINLATNVRMDIEVFVGLTGVWKTYKQQLEEGRTPDMRKLTHDDIWAGPFVHVNGKQFIDHKEMFFGNGNPNEEVPDDFRLCVDEQRAQFLRGLSRAVAYAKVLQPGGTAPQPAPR